MLRRWGRINVLASCLMLAWLLLLNAAFVMARLSLGAWPGPWNHPAATVPLELLSIAGDWLMIAAMLAPGGAWWIIARRLAQVAPAGRAVASVLLRSAGATAGCWLLTVGAGWWDPIGALQWMLD